MVELVDTLVLEASLRVRVRVPPGAPLKHISVECVSIWYKECTVSLYAVAGRPLDTSYEASQTATRVLAKEHSKIPVTTFLKVAYGTRQGPVARAPLALLETDDLAA